MIWFVFCIFPTWWQSRSLHCQLWKILQKSCLFFSMYVLFHVCTVCTCHVTYAFQSESTLYSYLNVKELRARSRREIWSLSDCNWTGAQNHLVRKRTLNHLVKWLSVRLRTNWFWVRVQLQWLKHKLLFVDISDCLLLVNKIVSSFSKLSVLYSLVVIFTRSTYTCIYTVYSNYLSGI